MNYQGTNLITDTCIKESSKKVTMILPLMLIEILGFATVICN